MARLSQSALRSSATDECCIVLVAVVMNVLRTADAQLLLPGVCNPTADTVKKAAASPATKTNIFIKILCVRISIVKFHL